MKLCKMIEMYLKYDNMYTIGIINAFVCINNHVNSFIKCMLSRGPTPLGPLLSNQLRIHSALILPVIVPPALYPAWTK